MRMGGVKSLDKQQSDFYLIYFLKTHLSQNCFYLLFNYTIIAFILIHLKNGKKSKK